MAQRRNKDEDILAGKSVVVKTDAIVLKTVKYGDTSKIVTAFTREYGKLSLIAKGARTNRSKFGSILNPMSCIQVVFYLKESRDIHLLSNASLSRVHKSIVEEPRKTMTGFVMLDALNTAVHVREPHPVLFDHLVMALDVLDQAEQAPMNALIAFLIALLREVGYGLKLDACVNCGRDLDREPLAFESQVGGFVCGRCSSSGRGLIIAHKQLKALQWLERSSPEAWSRLSFGAAESLKIVHLLAGHLCRHVPGAKRLKSLSLLESTVVG